VRSIQIRRRSSSGLKLRPEAYLKLIRRDPETRFDHYIGVVESVQRLVKQFVRSLTNIQ